MMDEHTKVDASTSTQDLEMRPLCLFYFSHPFAVLSPDPPTFARAPADLAQTYINMEPVSPFAIPRQYHPEDLNPKPSDESKETSNPSYELGHNLSRKPVRFQIPHNEDICYDKIQDDFHYNEHRCEDDSRQDAYSSTLLARHGECCAAEMFHCTRSTCCSDGHVKSWSRLPYNRNILPPLERPIPKDITIRVHKKTNDDSANSKTSRRVSLPPISVPKKEDAVVKDDLRKTCNYLENDDREDGKRRCGRSRNGCSRCMWYPKSSRGVRKGRRVPNKSGVRRLVTCLIQCMRRGRRRDSKSLLGLKEILQTIREAWEEPKTLLDRSSPHTAPTSHNEVSAMRRSGVPVDALAPRPGASPGLLCRRYSVPETIMRKYRLAQLRSADTEESETVTAPSSLRRPASPASPSASRSPSRGSCSSLNARRDREVMRKSALLRRLWSKNCGTASYASSGELCRPSRECQACETMCGQCDLQNSYDSSTAYRPEPKSLDGSQNDIRQWDKMSGSWITKTLKNQAAYQTVTDKGCECCRKLSLQYPIAGESRLCPSGYTPSSGVVLPHSPKRQRLESPNGVNKSNEMLKAAMRNSYDKMEEIHRQRECKRSSITECLTSTSSSTTFLTSKTETSTCQSSQLSTFSYPASSSETSSSFTKTPTSHSSEDPPIFRFTNRPTSADSASDNRSTDAAFSSVKKRRQNICSNSNSLESPSAQIKLESVKTTDETESTNDYDQNSDIKASDEKENSEMSSEGTVPLLASSPVSSEVEKKVKNSDVFPKKCNASTNTEDYAEKVSGTIPFVQKGIGENKYIEDNAIKKNDEVFGVGLKKLPKNIKLIDTPEMIEVVVSETVNSSALVDTPTSQQTCHKLQKDAPPELNQNILVPINSQKTKIDLDEYVSNILIESLNTLTDQIEGINASISRDRKVNIIEKEIKIKLQNVDSSSFPKVFTDTKTEKTFVKVAIPESEAANNNGNTASRHSDTDFSYESQLKSTYQESYCNNNFFVRDYPSLQLQVHEISDGRSPTNSLHKDLVDNGDLSFILSSDKVNQAVLQQIQKLFKDGFESLDSNLNYTHNHFSNTNLPEISHIEISNVDVFIENNSDGIDQEQKLHLLTDRVDNDVNEAMSENNNTDNLLSKMSTATYYKAPPEPVLVPRFTAYPRTESMEVNTSSSDEGDMVGSDCMSLVDSLDDPNSPRVKLSLQQSRQRTELVRSSVDVLGLLPDLSKDITRESRIPKDKSESFFIRIKDDECDCEKENIVVADHMPDKIKQKLFRRHKKRELRMEYAKRKKLRQLKRELEKQKKVESMEAKKDIENDCVSILSSLIDQVAKNAGDDIIKKTGRHCCVEEHKSTNISKKYPVKGVRRKSNCLQDLENFKISKQGNVQFLNTLSENTPFPKNVSTNINDRSIHEKDESGHIVTDGKLPIQPHTPLSPEDLAPKRVYQKSEFQDGNKKVEILEILEYLETSPENSDDSVPKHLRRYRRSKIPVPIYEKIHRGSKSKSFQKPFKNNIVVGGRYGLLNSSKTQSIEKHSNCKIDELIANILIDALHDKNSGVNFVNAQNDTMLEDYKRLSSNCCASIRQASVPPKEPVNSGSRTTHTPRYKHVFASIPEEKGSLSVESSNEDINSNRRSSLPSSSVNNNPSYDNNSHAKKESITKYVQTNRQTSPKARSKNVSTSTNSPILRKKEKEEEKKIVSPHKTNMKSATTSPMRRMVSAATSPIPQAPSNGNHQNGSNNHNGKILEHDYENVEKNKTANGKKSLSSHGTREGWVGFYNSKQKQAGHDEGNQKLYDSDKVEKPSHAESDVTPSPHNTVRTMESEKSKQITLSHEKETNFRVDTERTTKNKKSETVEHPDVGTKMKNSKELINRKTDDRTEKLNGKSSPKKSDSAKRYSQSDPQICTDYVITKTDTKRIQKISVQKSASEQSFDKSLKLPSCKSKTVSHSSEESTSDTESDSAKSLLCPLAPKWLGHGSRHKRLTRKKSNSQGQNGSNQNVSGWSVTVAGNCYATLPADVEMKLSFPKNGLSHPASQSNSGFGDGECKSRRNLALMHRTQVPSCQCAHCKTPIQMVECGHARRDLESNYTPFLPPAQQNKRMTLTVKKESTGSSVHTARSTKKQFETLPEVETYRSSKSKSKNSVKMARRFSLHCWLPEVDTESNLALATGSMEDGLSVTGCAIVPELKPHVPTMSERDLTRIYHTHYYSRP